MFPNLRQQVIYSPDCLGMEAVPHGLHVTLSRSWEYREAEAAGCSPDCLGMEAVPRGLHVTLSRTWRLSAGHSGSHFRFNQF